MEGMVYECPCGHVFTEAEIDFKAKKAVCKKCKSVVNLRQQANRSETVLGNIEPAVSAFLERDYERADNIAKLILGASDDNLPALFMRAYYLAHSKDGMRDNEQMDLFFNKQLPEIEPLDDEIDQLKKLLLHDPLHLANYEEQILRKMIDTQTADELAEFVDEFSSINTLNRKTIDWFTPGMVDTYSEVASITNTPKTWFALYKQVGENPDSPEVGNTFFLEKKVSRFFNNYVLGVEKIYNSIADPEQKTKFTTAYANRKQKFMEKM